jgi:hypothetical protein
VNQGTASSACNVLPCLNKKRAITGWTPLNARRRRSPRHIPATAGRRDRGGETCPAGEGGRGEAGESCDRCEPEGGEGSEEEEADREAAPAGSE